MKVTQAEINSFTEVLYAKYGFDFTCYEPQSLNRRINRVLHVLGYNTIHDLWTDMLQKPSMVYKFMDEVSVELTAMFRDPVMWSRLRSVLYNEFKAKQNLKIWIAGCSTGEEVYTLAIVLYEMGMLEQVQILATDMNNKALEVARSGIYHELKIIEYEKNYREYNKFGTFGRYFKKNSPHVLMRSDLLKNTLFKYHNLVTDKSDSDFDLILCRNVMIYFDAETKSKMVKNFHRHINDGGYLITGFFDSIFCEENQGLFNNELSGFRMFKKSPFMRVNRSNLSA
ncbi:protein-glutamate O-methyltransferase CheR [Mangrovivirga sp. M17]|uniref:Protein-glutamate O-methyltransferase CheR n=1 Tax=Mangrovivirga halotolerans TaxID=2993936 RepID=A0ABT3RN20_9BACT|nr:protein-glutamate O-methyltransferase CheR [Mangrovivirga halotolerans]MCX2743207.1 protein-glutamate O-methyltransferase CheR [Mangrovivirga halotolerans]